MAAESRDASDLRTLLSRHPAGVCVLTVRVGEQKLGLTVASLVSLSLDPPLVGFAVSREAAMHELLREAGGCALSLLAAGQEWLAQHFARGVPPIAMWHRIATSEGANGAPLLVGALGWLECGIREEVERGNAHVLRLRRSPRRARRRRRRHSFASAASTRARERIDAVVFDLDGVLIDSEHVWDEVREELARERGGRWHERGAGGHDGHELDRVVALPARRHRARRDPRGDQRRGRPAHAGPLRASTCR